MKVLIKGGRVIDPASNTDAVLDVLIEAGQITKIERLIKDEAGMVIDAKDKIVMPGLVDMHVHLREPGREDKETVESGTKAAAKGGITSLLAMPNTQPPMDSVEHIQMLKGIIKKTASVNVFIAGAITKERRGEELTDIPLLKKEGAVAITDDGSSVDSDAVMFSAFEHAKIENLLVICHCEDKSLSQKGVVNLGFTSTRMGLRGISKESEYKRVARDLELAQRAGANVHIAHVSCLESVELIARAKKKGVKVSAETAPHYFALTEEAALGYDANKKMNPPLRSKEDAAAIKQGLGDGTIDAIASDHAGHTLSEKNIEFEHAEFGVIGLETELAVAITDLVEPGILSWIDLAREMALAPAEILGIDKGRLGPGKDADIIVVSPDKEWLVDKDGFVSMSQNSAFLGRTLKGEVEYTICAGKVVYHHP